MLHKFMILSKRINIKEVFLCLAVILVAGLFVIWDMQRLDKDFNRLFLLLKTARVDAFYKSTIITVRFDGDMVTVSDQKDSKSITTTMPTISKVDYDTTMGNNRVVFDWRGTAAYNKRIHGGEIMLLSLLGFKRYIHVNCNGMVMEGRYPEDK